MAVSDTLILVVDDNADHRELIVQALALRCDRARIAVALDGSDALDFLLGQGVHASRDLRKQPRLVIMDLRMAPMDGLATVRAMRANPHTAGIPVVMLTGTSDKAELDSCYGAGANSVVRKSTSFDELRQKMATVHDFWLTVNEANRASRV